jgi:hypothetical protein
MDPKFLTFSTFFTFFLASVPDAAQKMAAGALYP